jgi:RNA polymerase sigma factor (TIGR02999 family)
MSSEIHDTTVLLGKWAQGDKGAYEALMPRVYRELRRLAGHIMQGEKPGNTMQPTALVHEVYLRLIDIKNVDWRGRAHFFALCAQLMRYILLDSARRRMASRRGGGARPLPLHRIPDLGAMKDRHLIALDDALKALTEVDPRKGKVVELRYFGGLSVEETAGILEVSKETVARDWRMAKSWLLAELNSGDAKPR